MQGIAGGMLKKRARPKVESAPEAPRFAPTPGALSRRRPVELDDEVAADRGATEQPAAEQAVEEPTATDHSNSATEVSPPLERTHRARDEIGIPIQLDHEDEESARSMPTATVESDPQALVETRARVESLDAARGARREDFWEPPTARPSERAPAEVPVIGIRLVDETSPAAEQPGGDHDAVSGEPGPEVVLVRPTTDDLGRGRPRQAILDENGKPSPRSGPVNTSLSMSDELHDAWRDYARNSGFTRNEILLDAFDHLAPELESLVGEWHRRVSPVRSDSMFQRPKKAEIDGGPKRNVQWRIQAHILEVIDGLAEEHHINRSALVRLVLGEYLKRNG